MSLKNYDHLHALLNHEDSSAISARLGNRNVRQGSLYVQAKTKVEAAEILNRLGYKWEKPRDLRVGMGLDLEACVEAGLLEQHDAIVKHDSGLIVAVDEEDGVVKRRIIGEVKRNFEASGYEQMFVPFPQEG